uniref:Uncharacterized protein n=1 Tax=Fagus sylvatica TaxID=28930 RepID=A0A2N9IUE4_FAGSY
MSNFIVKDFQHFNVLSDCSELFDSTHELLDWSLTKFQDPNVTDFGTRNLKFDLQTWLSGAITNLATCNDELVGTNMSTILKDKIIVSLEKVTTLVNDQWAFVQQMPDDTVGHDFQSWFDSHDWKLMQADAISANITVASDGSGDFTSIMEAVKATPNNSLARFVIYIKKATYKEYVSIPLNKWNIMMVGDGMDQTIISGSHSNTTGYGTYGSATFAVDGQQFVAVDITFENIAGPKEGQAKCEILPRQALPGQSNTITAQGRDKPNSKTGFSFHLCTISGDSDLISSANPTPTFLGRPWKTYSRTVFMETFMSNIINPEGWLRWNSSFESTLFYGEYKNTGPGASTDKRVNWPGVHILDSSQAQLYTVSQFLDGNSWLPPTDIPYNGGLEG